MCKCFSSECTSVSIPGRMPLNAGATGYGSVAGPRLSASAGGSESAPLLIPEPEPEPFQQWQPLTKEELEVAAGGPGWRKARCSLMLMFWLAWLAMLAVAIAIVVMSPRPVETPLKWWQKSLFYRLQPDLLTEKHAALCEQLPYLRALGIGALILEGLFDKKASPSNLNATGERFGALPQIQHLLAESNRAGEWSSFSGNEDNTSKLSATVQKYADTFPLRFWLEQGVAGFAICDTDAEYSGKTLLEWKGVFNEFSSEEKERYCKASIDLKELLLLLVMTLPGSPAVQYDEDLDQVQEKKRSVAALFSTLSHSRAREEALLFGSFTFLPFNSSTYSSSSNSTLPSPSPPILAFLRSWGCVHFLILLNVGPEPGALEPTRAPSLPKAGVFVANTRMDRMGSTTLDTLELRPHEAIVIKLFEPGSYS
uniref:Si:dkey-202g17.3 n=1 Tax=Cyclopterus lumpus TaxID=8103 RepID=A0A8C2ZR60_CYCLU